MRLAEFRRALDAWRRGLSTPLGDDDIRVDLGRRVGGGSYGRAYVRRDALARRTYQAMIRVDDPLVPDRKVTVTASSLTDARAKLEAEHGQGTVFNLHNEVDSAKPR